MLHGLIEEGIIKWAWGSLGLLICAIPVFFKMPGVVGTVDFGSRTEGTCEGRQCSRGAELTVTRFAGFVTNRRLLLSASDALGRLMSTYRSALISHHSRKGSADRGCSPCRELSELSGYTQRVSELLDTMEEIKVGKYQKKLVSSAGTEENAKGSSSPAPIDRRADLCPSSQFYRAAAGSSTRTTRSCSIMCPSSPLTEIS